MKCHICDKQEDELPEGDDLWTYVFLDGDDLLYGVCKECAIKECRYSASAACIFVVTNDDKDYFPESEDETESDGSSSSSSSSFDDKKMMKEYKARFKARKKLRDKAYGEFGLGCDCGCGAPDTLGCDCEGTTIMMSGVTGYMDGEVELHSCCRDCSNTCGRDNADKVFLFIDIPATREFRRTAKHHHHPPTTSQSELTK